MSTWINLFSPEYDHLLHIEHNFGPDPVYTPGVSVVYDNQSLNAGGQSEYLTLSIDAAGKLLPNGANASEMTIHAVRFIATATTASGYSVSLKVFDGSLNPILSESGFGSLGVTQENLALSGPILLSELNTPPYYPALELSNGSEIMGTTLSFTQFELFVDLPDPPPPAEPFWTNRNLTLERNI